MKLADAQQMIYKAKEPKTYFVCFEVHENGMLRTDKFPEKGDGEKGFSTASVAWEWANDFAKVDPDKYVNIFIRDSNFNIVEKYYKQKLNRYSPGGAK